MSRLWLFLFLLLVRVLKSDYRRTLGPDDCASQHCFAMNSFKEIQ